MLKVIPHGDVQKQLQISYDSLTNRAKKLFLDIACFFNYMKKDLVVKVLQDEDSAFFPEIEIQYLVDKSLVEITSHNRLQMHHVIREMGQEIVRQENEDEPGQRTRLWDRRDVTRVLAECSGTESVESIITKLPHSDQRDSNLESLNTFRKTSNLRLVNLWGDGESPSDEITHLCFKKLKYMFWHWFPLKTLNNIDMCNVVVLIFKNSKLETFWEGIKSLKKLRILNVSFSRSLTKTGSLSGLENLEELYFYCCEKLEELHESIVDLQKLAILDLRASIPSKRIPWELIGKLASLREVKIGRHPRVDLEPDEVNDALLYSLKECPITKLMCDGCNISMISAGVVSSLTRLKQLRLCDTRFFGHPDSLLQLHGLNKFKLERCYYIESIPNLPEYVTSVRVYSCRSLVNLPGNISELKSLTSLDLYDCPKLGIRDPDFLMKVTRLTKLSYLTVYNCGVSQVPSEIGNLVSLKKLNLLKNPLSSLPDSLSNLSQLVDLDIRGCELLRQLPLIPPNLTKVAAHGCSSLDVMSSASIRTKVCKESSFVNRFTIHLPWKEGIPEWCSYLSRGDVLSFEAPLDLNNICGIIVFVGNSDRIMSNVVLKMYNKTKNTSRLFEVNVQESYMGIMSCPLDKTTLLVEPGDSLILKLPKELVSICGLRLIYESDVVDSKLVITPLSGITNCSQGDNVSCTTDDD